MADSEQKVQEGLTRGSPLNSTITGAFPGVSRTVFSIHIVRRAITSDLPVHGC